MKKRIIGIDVARALAVIGMIIVNFKIVFGSKGNESLNLIASIFDGKAAATFVVLAGIGIALMSNSAIKNNDTEKLKRTRIRIIKRALFLFVIGLSYIVIWPADILHFYGIYMLVALALLSSFPKRILIFAISMIFIYPFLMVIWDYESGWNFDTLTYLDFWSFDGFFRNLFYNGFHPVIPWTSFMLIGLWFGKQNINDDSFLKKTLRISLIVFILGQIISYFLIFFLSGDNLSQNNELTFFFGTSPMPPLPIYMITGSSIALFIIAACILIAKKFENNWIINALNKTGQLALTFYVAHVIIGMGFISEKEFGNYSIEFSLAYALSFSLGCILFAVIWRKYKTAGPLEWLMRKLTD